MKYSLDYAEGYLEGLGLTIIDSDSKPLKFSDVLKSAWSEIDFDYEEETSDKIIKCMCTSEFVKVHPMD